MYRQENPEFGAFLEKTFPEETTALGKYGAKSVTIQVTDSCNLRCSYCYQINKKQNFIKVEDAKKFIDYVLFSNSNYCNTNQSAGLILEFIGGEPFLAIDTINEITAYTIQQMAEHNHPWLYRTKIAISTNGTLYFEPKVQAYLKKYHSMLSLGISIDGNKELHDKCRLFPDGSGSYDIAMEAVKHYRKYYKEDPPTKMTLAPANITHTFEAIKSLIENGYTDIAFNCVFEEGWTLEHARIYYDQLKQIADYILANPYLLHNLYTTRFNSGMYKPLSPNDNENSCGGLGKMLAINHTDHMFPCIRYMESSLGSDVPEVIIGDLQTGIMGTDKYSAIVDEMQSITRRSQSTDECFYCPIAAGCSWCSAYNYQYYKKFGKRTTFLCVMHKAESLANAYYWNKFYLQEEISEVFVVHIPDEWALEIVSADELTMIKELENQASINAKPLQHTDNANNS